MFSVKHILCYLLVLGTSTLQASWVPKTYQSLWPSFRRYASTDLRSNMQNAFAQARTGQPIDIAPIKDQMLNLSLLAEKTQNPVILDQLEALKKPYFALQEIGFRNDIARALGLKEPRAQGSIGHNITTISAQPDTINKALEQQTRELQNRAIHNARTYLTTGQTPDIAQVAEDALRTQNLEYAAGVLGNHTVSEKLRTLWPLQKDLARTTDLFRNYDFKPYTVS